MRRPNETSGLSIWLGPVPIIAWHRTGSVEGPGPCAARTAECASAILICLRMNARSEGVTVNPWPTVLALAGDARPIGSSSATIAETVAVATALTLVVLLRPEARS